MQENNTGRCNSASPTAETTPDHKDEKVNECVRMTKICLNCSKYRVNTIPIGHSIKVLDTTGQVRKKSKEYLGKHSTLNHTNMQ